jgi:hypothetical protein
VVKRPPFVSLIQFNSKVIYFGKCEYIHIAPVKHVIKFTREKLVHVVENQNVMDFAKSNFLRLNAKKTNLLQIHTAQTKRVENPHITDYS